MYKECCRRENKVKKTREMWEKEWKWGKTNGESLKKTKIGEEGMPKEMKEKKRASEGEKWSVSQPKHRKRQSRKEKGKKHLLTEMRSPGSLANAASLWTLSLSELKRGSLPSCRGQRSGLKDRPVVFPLPHIKRALVPPRRCFHLLWLHRCVLPHCFVAPAGD